jgi:NitT/TauT family transport system ATP-binding protein
LDEYSRFILKQLGIDHLLDRYPKTERRSAAEGGYCPAFILKPICCSWTNRFRLWMLTREEMQELFLNIWQQNNVTTVFYNP